MKLCILIWIVLTLTTQANAYSKVNAFKDASKDLYFERSQLGYGYLVPKGFGSELGVVNKRALECNEAPTPYKGIDFSSWESLERKHLSFISSLYLAKQDSIQTYLPIHDEFIKLLNNKNYFYSTKESYNKKIFGNKNSDWASLSTPLKSLIEKYSHLEQKILPSNNVKAAILLDILASMKGPQYRNIEVHINNSYFLLDQKYRESARSLVMSLFEKKSQEEYSNFINIYKNKFHAYGYFLKKINDKVIRAHKLMLRGKNQNIYENFLRLHQSKLTKFKNFVLKNGHPLINNQAFAEGKIISPTCDIPAITLQCSGFSRNNNISKITSNFYQEYFKAWREYQVNEGNSNFSIKLNLKFLKTEEVSRYSFSKAIKNWQQWSDSFFNKNQGYYGKTVQFNISFTEANKSNDDIINVRKCWNSSANSIDCKYKSQANAQNFPLDIKKDTLLEEVGHHLGLFDEYYMYYYIYNPLGASDSFMTAMQNYKIYPEHIERILTPHLKCK